jgi:hypothetical protein
VQGVDKRFEDVYTKAKLLWDHVKIISVPPKNMELLLYLILKNKLERSSKVNILKQLTLLAIENIEGKLKYRFKRVKDADTISDMYDGSLYHEYSAKFKLDQDWSRITLTMWSDGAQAFKSSKKSLWPLVFSINGIKFEMSNMSEFEPSLRHKFEHVIFGGFYMFNKQPHFPTYLLPVVKQLITIGAVGFKVAVKTADDTTVKTVRAYLMLVLADLPAKVKILGIHSYNSKEGGCNNCDHRPERLEDFKKYVYTNYPSAKIYHRASEKPKKRYKYFSPLLLLDYFDPVRSCAVDPMVIYCLLSLSL